MATCQTSLKFSKQASSCFTVAKIKQHNANDLEGVRLNSEDYTGKSITIIKRFVKYMKEEKTKSRNSLKILQHG